MSFKELKTLFNSIHELVEAHLISCFVNERTWHEYQVKRIISSDSHQFVISPIKILSHALIVPKSEYPLNTKRTLLRKKSINKTVYSYVYNLEMGLGLASQLCNVCILLIASKNSLSEQCQ